MPIVYKGVPASDPERTVIHWRTKGSKNGVRIWQNEDGSYTPAGENFKPGGRYNQSEHHREDNVKTMTPEEKRAQADANARAKAAKTNARIANRIPYSRDDLTDYEKQQELGVMTAQLKYATAVKEYQQTAEANHAEKLKHQVKHEISSYEAKIIVGVGVAAIGVGIFAIAGGSLTPGALEAILTTIDPTGAVKLAGKMGANYNVTGAQAQAQAQPGEQQQVVVEGEENGTPVDDDGGEVTKPKSVKEFFSDLGDGIADVASKVNGGIRYATDSEYRSDIDANADATAAYEARMKNFDDTVAKAKAEGTEVPKAEDRWDYDDRVKNGEDVGEFSDYWAKRQSGEIEGRLQKQQTAPKSSFDRRSKEEVDAMSDADREAFYKTAEGRKWKEEQGWIDAANARKAAEAEAKSKAGAAKATSDTTPKSVAYKTTDAAPKTTAFKAPTETKSTAAKAEPTTEFTKTDVEQWTSVVNDSLRNGSSAVPDTQDFWDYKANPNGAKTFEEYWTAKNPTHTTRYDAPAKTAASDYYDDDDMEPMKYTTIAEAKAALDRQNQEERLAGASAWEKAANVGAGQTGEESTSSKQGLFSRFFGGKSDSTATTGTTKSESKTTTKAASKTGTKITSQDSFETVNAKRAQAGKRPLTQADYDNLDPVDMMDFEGWTTYSAPVGGTIGGFTGEYRTFTAAEAAERDSTLDAYTRQLMGDNDSTLSEYLKRRGV